MLMEIIFEVPCTSNIFRFVLQSENPTELYLNRAPSQAINMQICEGTRVSY